MASLINITYILKTEHVSIHRVLRFSESLSCKIVLALLASGSAAITSFFDRGFFPGWMWTLATMLMHVTLLPPSLTAHGVEVTEFVISSLKALCIGARQKSTGHWPVGQGASLERLSRGGRAEDKPHVFDYFSSRLIQFSFVIFNLGAIFFLWSNFLLVLYWAVTAIPLSNVEDDESQSNKICEKYVRHCSLADT